MKFISLILFILLTGKLPAQNRYDVIIDEIMADPSPPAGLPNHEWIELKNVSLLPLNLQGWRIADGSGQSGPMPAYILPPDSFVIVSSAAAAVALSSFGPVIAVTGFPSLDNEGELLFLKDIDDRTIHAVEYSADWYNNTIKREGGWSLEMIDTQNPCAGINNWKAASDPSGATPGRKNSVDGINSDRESPLLKKVYATDSLTLVAVFNEPVDSSGAAIAGNYTLDGGPVIESAVPLPPLFQSVQLRLNTAFLFKKSYILTSSGIPDCRGNRISGQSSAKTGLPEEAQASDLVVNEILFNPPANGYDYVEIYNRSHRIIDAARVFLATRNSADAIRSAIPLSRSPLYIFPGDYWVATEDASSLQLQYFVKEPDKITVVSPMPSFPDDEGDVLLLNNQGERVDEVHYSAAWHFKLIDNPEAVSLERMDPDGPSEEKANWHSAASTSGYGTPTMVNSQFKQTVMADAAIAVQPRVFSPDNDGLDDIASIQYKLGEPGYVANITIFDAAGRPVRILVNNGTLGLSGYWNWDGLNDKGSKLPMGTYIVYTEIFNLQGKRKKFKNVVVLAGKLN